MKLVNEALAAMRRVAATEDPYLKGSKYLWLKSPAHLSARQEERLLALRHVPRNTSSANGIVEEVVYVFLSAGSLG